MPDGGIAFASTAPLQGVPCNASVNVAMTYRMEADRKTIRQLCFDQDHNYCLTVTNDGRLLYLRWEYTDIPHVWARRLFTMNPDGTGQREFYGSGDFWPNAIFYARPIPDHPTKVVGIVTGHHVGRVGELVLFDAERGRSGASGVVQRIPGRGKPVEPIIVDRLTEESWPKFLHPYPLSDKYFLVSAKPTPNDLWGIYLVDVFDNMVLIKELEDYALLGADSVPPRTRPPVIPSTVDLRRQDAVVYLEDVYAGPGVERGAARRGQGVAAVHLPLRLPGHAGISHRVGSDGPWEPKRVLGTVPVEADGSALFRVPANTPISFQPLDGEGKALQLMRSWATAMPGETVSCVGCHEGQNSGPPNRATLAAKHKPAEIAPWRGPTRGFSFKREVQPVLDKYCVACHNGSPQPDGRAIPDLRGDQGKFVVVKGGDPAPRIVAGDSKEQLFKKYAGVFEPVVHRAAPLRPGRRIRERHPLAGPGRVPRRHDRVDPDAPQRALRRGAGRRGLGPAGHLDRPERPLPWDVARDGRRREDAARPPAADRPAQALRRPDDDPEVIPDSPPDRSSPFSPSRPLKPRGGNARRRRLAV